MTLIAAFSSYERPVIIGDLLLSRENTDTPITNLPAFNTPALSNINSYLPPVSEAYISGLCRKVIPINDYCAMAWAGHTIAAKSVCREIRELLEQSGNNYDALSKYVKALRPEHFGAKISLGFCVIFIAGDKMKMLGWNGKKFEGGFCDGTGSDDFIAIQKSAELYNVSKVCEDPVVESIHSAIGIIGKLLGDQIREGGGIKSFYGGGFELATPYGGKIHFIPITYLFLSATLEKDGQLTLTIYSMLAFSYREDFLIVNRLLPHPSDPQREIYILSPLYRRVLVSETSPEDFEWPETQFAFAYVHFPQASGDQGLLGITQYLGGGLKLIQIDGSTSAIEISEEITSNIYKHAMEVCRD